MKAVRLALPTILTIALAAGIIPPAESGPKTTGGVNSDVLAEPDRAGQSPGIAQFRHNLRVLRDRIIPLAEDLNGPLDNATLVEAQLALNEGIQGLLKCEIADLVAWEGGGAAVRGVVKAGIALTDPHRFADSLILQNLHVPTEGAAIYMTWVEGSAYRVIRELPGMVTIDAADIAQRLLLDMKGGNCRPEDTASVTGALETAKAVAQHNIQRKGFAPAETLVMYHSRRQEAVDLIETGVIARRQ